MTAQEMIESNKNKIESKRLELISLIKGISKAKDLKDFRNINIEVGKIQDEMDMLFRENQIISALSNDI